MCRYVKNIFKGYTKIVVWGTGNYYTLYKDLLNGKATYFVDNNAEKWGASIGGKRIVSPEKLREEDTCETLIIVCNNYFEEIAAQVNLYGKFDIIDIVTVGLLREKEKELLAAKEPGAGHMIAVCGGIHAMWQTNGSRKFIDGQLTQLHQSGFHTIEIVPLLYYQAGKRESSFLAVSVDGVYQGMFSADELARMYPKIRGMIIHSLYYSQETMETLLESMTVETKVLYYIHDFSCICPHRFLWREGEPCIDSDGNMACSTCCENGRRRNFLQFYSALFKKYKVILIAPSADTKARVELYYKNIDIVELPHLEFEQELFEKNVNGRIRVAYVGVAIFHKGWDQFARLVDRFHQKYDFYCLGDCPDDLKIQDVTYIPVGLEGSGHVLTMAEALLQYSIDMAYIGSVWPETYSYTYYEAYEAGCCILTNTRSGNVYSQVTANQNGFSFLDEDEMMAWLESDMVRKEILKINKRIINVRNSQRFLQYFQS